MAVFALMMFFLPLWRIYGNFWLVMIRCGYKEGLVHRELTATCRASIGAQCWFVLTKLLIKEVFQMTVAKRFSAIVVVMFVALSMMMAAHTSVALAASFGYSYGYTVTEKNSNTATRTKNTDSSVRNEYYSGLPDVRVAVYAVRSNGTSYNATNTAAKYVNMQPGQTRDIYNSVNEDGHNRAYLSMSAYPGWSAYCSGKWYPDI